MSKPTFHERLSIALAFAQLEFAEVTAGKRYLHDCPGIRNLAELMPESRKRAIESSARDEQPK